MGSQTITLSEKILSDIEAYAKSLEGKVESKKKKPAHTPIIGGRDIPGDRPPDAELSVELRKARNGGE